MTDWWDFVSRYLELRDTNAAQVAKKAGYDKAQLSKWRQGASVSPKLARDTALALNAPVLDAFIAAGYLRPEDTTAEVIERPVSELGDEELLAEVRQRMKGARHGVAGKAQSDASPEAVENQEVRRYVVLRCDPRKPDVIVQGPTIEARDDHDARDQLHASMDLAGVTIDPASDWAVTVARVGAVTTLTAIVRDDDNYPAREAQAGEKLRGRAAELAAEADRPGVVRHLRPADDDNPAPDFSDTSLAARNVPDEPKD
jgi:transcriptional regulator with XRE-family HTH domain